MALTLIRFINKRITARDIAVFCKDGQTPTHFIWATTLNNKLSINNLTSDAQENIYMVGSMDSSVILGVDTLTDVGFSDVFLAKFDSSANVLWAYSAGSPAEDNGYSITLDNCDNLWIAGGFRGPMSFNGHVLALPTGPDPAFIAEYNDSGLYLASTSLASGGDDYLGILADKRGNFYLGGDYRSSSLVFGPDTVIDGSTNEELLIAKYNYGPPCSNVGDTVYQHTDTVVCVQSDTTTIALTAPAGVGYLWYDGATSRTRIINVGGTYWVSYSSGGHFITDTFYVTFAATSPPCATIAGVNAPSPETHDKILVFPNPATNGLIVSSSGDLITQISITNLIGQTVLSRQYNANQAQIDVSSFHSGVYFSKSKWQRG